MEKHFFDKPDTKPSELCRDEKNGETQHLKNEMTPADTRPGKAMRIPVITQNMPENGARIAPAAAGEAPTQQQIEQAVTATNPSVESMESRG